MQRKKVNDDEILRLHREGKSQVEIARICGVSNVAIHKRLRRLIPPPDLSRLTRQQRVFVERVTGGEGLIESVKKAYKPGSSAAAHTTATELIKNPEVIRSIQDLMEYVGLTRHYRIEKLKAHVDNPDAGISLKALDMSFRLDNSYPPQRINVDEHRVQVQVAHYAMFVQPPPADMAKESDDESH